MRTNSPPRRLLMAVLTLLVAQAASAQAPKETPAQRDARMAWWREARFGMFIHWGLYAVPAGEWKGVTKHAEWIRTTAQIPLDEYDQFRARFNPTRFDADAWVKMAKDAGMKYIVITSKHHDGFCLWDSQQTDFDVMSTPFKRDILAELEAACRRAGDMQFCMYHSIMDWHHPDYLPRRDWEKNRSTDGANFDRFHEYLRAQLKELVTGYNPGVLWFDGEWEDTWTHAYGGPLYDYVRGLNPAIIVNNRVDKGRGGMAGMTTGDHAGDFGTPEQEVPATGIPGADWESCITMNGNWGYNKADKNFKSTPEMIRMLVDIASKGGNLLLNIGPMATGEFPPESVQRLKEIGAWMQRNGESIYGTQASPLGALPWGRCTLKPLPGGDTRLYLHVFESPADGKLVVPGLLNELRGARLLAGEADATVAGARVGDALVLSMPRLLPADPSVVVVVDLAGPPDIGVPPGFGGAPPIFVGSARVAPVTTQKNVELRYTTDGAEPSADSALVSGPIVLTDTKTIALRSFRDGKPVSPTVREAFTKVTPRAGVELTDAKPGLRFEYFEGAWDKLPDFDALKPAKSGPAPNFDLSVRARPDGFGLRFRGHVKIEREGVYTFYTESDDGSRLSIGEQLVVDNDGPHSPLEKSGMLALAAGFHAITVTFFERDGGDSLAVSYAGPDLPKQRIPPTALWDGKIGSARAISEDVLPRPTAAQLAWQQMELIAFVHFGLNTFTNREWGEGTEDPGLFNPTDFAAAQWVAALKDGGFRQVILTAKHHDGFCLWPTKFTSHSVRSSPWKGGQGDVVGEVAAACRAAGLKFGVYLSPWDRHEPSYGDSPRYNEHFKNQLTELLTTYGPVHEVWFDGACGEGPNGRKQVYDWPAFIDVVRKHAPDAVIFSDAGPDVRWVGNENGFAGETNWSTLRRDEFYPGTPNYKQLMEGHEDGTHWVPAECDVSIRPGWFHHPAEDDKVKSLAQLLDIYYGSVGRNAVFLLNVPPDARGRIHEQDVARLREFRAALDETFSRNLAHPNQVVTLRDAVPIAAESAVRPEDSDRPAPAHTPAVGATTILADLGDPTSFDRLMLAEDVRGGQRVRAWTAEALVAGEWKPVARGTTIGYKRLLRLDPPITATQVRVRIDETRAGKPAVTIGLFKAGAREVSAFARVAAAR